MFWINLNPLSSHLEHLGFWKTVSMRFLPSLFQCTGQKKSWDSFVLPAPFQGGSTHPWESHLLPANKTWGAAVPGMPHVSEQGWGCVWGCPRGREGSSMSHTPQLSPAAHTPCGRVGFPGGDTSGIGCTSGKALGKTSGISSRVPSPLPCAGEKEIIPRSTWASRACGTFHLMRILFILSGATNLSSEHFVLIKN